MEENKNSYSIIEAAKIIGISRQGLYKYIDELKEKGYIYINKNKQSREITQEGINYLQEKFRYKRNVTNIIIEEPKEDKNSLPSLIENDEFINTIKFGYKTLTEQFQILQIQNKEKDTIIAEKDKRIAELTDRITEFTEKGLNLVETKQNNINNCKTTETSMIKEKNTKTKHSKNKTFLKDFFNIKINKK